jgi:hypothetical protein
MKYFAYSILFVFTIAFFSCEKEDSNSVGPDLRFNAGPGLTTDNVTLKYGEEVKIKISASSGTSNITLFRFTIDQDGEIFTVDSGINTSDFLYERTIPKGTAETEIWTFMVRDKNLKSDEISITFNLDGNISYQSINQSGPITLGAQFNSSLESFYSFSDNSVYYIADAFNNQENIHFVYFYDNITDEENVLTGTGANIDESVFPQENVGIVNWTSRYTIRFVRKTNLISIEDFDNCDNDSLMLANTFEFATGKRKAKNLVNDDIFSFVTQDQRIGFLKVINVVGENAGSIEFELKWRD